MSAQAVTDSLIHTLTTQPTDVVEVVLAALDEDQLRRLALELATRMRPPTVEPGPTAICASATRLAAQEFGTLPELLLAKNRHRPIPDARAVAQAAARRCHITLSAIAAHFGQHHASVMTAIDKVAASPELSAIAERIAAHLLEPTVTHPGRAA